MSYDLFFFKRKNSGHAADEIINYLRSYPAVENEYDSGTQWFIENDDTETYFSFELNEIDDQDFPEESAAGYENTGFTFNINFMRPDFFGREAFGCVDNMIKDLDLYVINPQVSERQSDLPFKPEPEELYKNWSQANARISSEYYKKSGLNYYPPEKSDYFYEYNLNKKKTQERLGENYYVPKLYLFKSKDDEKIFTVSTWTDCIPNVFPPADYYLITRIRKKLFKTVRESGLISAKALFEQFAEFLEDFNFKNCKVIHPGKAATAGKLFNSIKFEHKPEEFAERLPAGNTVNNK